MKLLIKIAVFIFVAFTLAFLGAYIFIAANGKKIATEKLSAAIGKPVFMGQVSVVYPLSLKIYDLKIDGYGSAKEVGVGFGVFHLFDKNFSFSSLVLTEPQLAVHRTKDSNIIVGGWQEPAAVVAPVEPGSVTEPAATAPKEEKEAEPVTFSADRLLIKGGIINFFDHSMNSAENSSPLQVAIQGINLKARNVTFSEKDRGQTRFELSANIMDLQLQAPGGKIEAKGWANLAKKDMKAEVKITGLDARLFSPYYASSSKTDFKKFIADLSADLESHNNDMMVKGKIEVMDMAFAPETDEDKSASIESLIFQGLQSVAKQIAIEFKFKTKMDSFKVESISFSGNIFSGS